MARFKEALDNMQREPQESGVSPAVDFTVFGFEDGLLNASLIDKADGKASLSFTSPIITLGNQGANFFIRAAMPAGTNESAATEMAQAMNVLWSCTELFDRENSRLAQVIMDIFFRDDHGQVVSKLAVDVANR